MAITLLCAMFVGVIVRVRFCCSCSICCLLQIVLICFSFFFFFCEAVFGNDHCWCTRSVCCRCCWTHKETFSRFPFSTFCWRHINLKLGPLGSIPRISRSCCKGVSHATRFPNVARELNRSPAHFTDRCAGAN